jgi:hypothetical protein
MAFRLEPHHVRPAIIRDSVREAGKIMERGFGGAMSSRSEQWIVKSVDFSDISGRAGEYYRVVLTSGSVRCPISLFVTEGALGMIAHKSGLLYSGIARQEIVLDVVSEFVCALLRTGWDPMKTPPRELEANAAEYLFLHGRMEGCGANSSSDARKTKIS